MLRFVLCGESRGLEEGERERCGQDAMDGWMGEDREAWSRRSRCSSGPFAVQLLLLAEERPSTWH